MFPITSFTASLGHDGNIDIFALALSPQAPQGQGATVFRIRQKKAGGDWQPWANAGKPGHGAVGVRSITDIAGHGHVLADGAAGHLWFNERRPDDSFSGWQALGVPPLDPANADFPGDAWAFIRMWGVTRTDGQIDVVGTAGRNTGSGIFHRSRPAHANWTPWSPLLGNNNFFGDIVAATDYRGGLDIVTPLAVSADAAGLAHKRRRPDGTWTDWTMLGTPPGGLSVDITPVLVNGSDSPLGPELFAVAVDSTIWHNAQTAAGDWSDWASLGNAGGPVTGIAVAQDGVAGALHVCATHKNNTVTHRRQANQGGPWTGWTNLGAPDADAIANPALICDSEGYLNLLLTRPAKDGMITLRQTAGGRFVKTPAISALPPH
jgi:hypothetical protein